MINQRIILPILFGIFTFLSSTSLYADQMDEDWVEQGSREEGLMMNNEIQNSDDETSIMDRINANKNNFNLRKRDLYNE